MFFFFASGVLYYCVSHVFRKQAYGQNRAHMSSFNWYSWLQVWKEVDQGRTDQREADGGSTHWNPMGVCDLHCFGQRPTDFL